jgi:sporulation protein YlmC with PRC-barrel domain
MDPHDYLRLQLPVRGGQGRSLGRINALKHDPDTGRLTALVVQHGLLRQRRTRVPAHQVKWVNQDSVVLGYTRSAFRRLPAD